MVSNSIFVWFASLVGMFPSSPFRGYVPLFPLVSSREQGPRCWRIRKGQRSGEYLEVVGMSISIRGMHRVFIFPFVFVFPYVSNPA